MKIANGLSRVLTTVTIGVLTAALMTACQPQPSSFVEIDDDDIGGVVASADGPEAGVWVIAETDDFETRFARIVVTDDQGQYVIPDLPAANYSVWVRGYGLADSAKIEVTPGQVANLTARVAPDPVTAAQVYPAAYWYSMVALPDEDEIADIPGGMNEYLTWTKNMGCIGCHQLGQLSTRSIPEELGEFGSSQEAWVRRVQSGQAGGQMFRQATGTLLGLPFKYLADWTDRIAAGSSSRCRTQRCCHGPGLGHALRLHARLDLYRPAQPDDQCVRIALWSSRAQHGRLSNPRSHRQCGDKFQGDGHGSGDAVNP